MFTPINSPLVQDQLTYNTISPSPAAGATVVAQADSHGNAQVNLNSYISGEDPTATANNATGVMVAEQRYSKLAILSANTGIAVKASPGFLHGIVVGDPGTTWVISIYDALSATGTPLILKPTALGFIPIDALYSVGIWFVSSGTPGTIMFVGR